MIKFVVEVRINLMVLFERFERMVVRVNVKVVKVESKLKWY